MPSVRSVRPVKVLLTGFGPFRTHTINASFEIVKRVFESINNSAELEEGSDAETEETTGTGGKGRREIDLVIQPEPIRVSYADVDNLLSELYQHDAPFDLVIHTGVANLNSASFLVEKFAHRLAYSSPDVNGKLPQDSVHNSPGPDRLTTSIKLDGPLLESVKELIQHPIELKVSENAGRYLCEYIYYGSLAAYEKVSRSSKGKSSSPREEKDVGRREGPSMSRPVLFVHVPPLLSLPDLALGAAVLEALIRELVHLHFPPIHH
ncbi:hypothetical protein PCASD_09941 [Puccinia coronata f. sp. avenae]|uniref:Pyroglutamyl-peptidase I n=1 Tax=Puccinia coronata f. sp. avenae TaxID=200324 RepID=A0A2N5UJT0_9BASI|nr:hypothetical protein PCASD_09941 [Puccinia coronata f. sp. avenae]